MRRIPLYSLVIALAANGWGIGAAMAGEYTYSMAAAEAESPDSGDSTISSGSGGSKIDALSARYLVAQDEASASASSPRADDADTTTVPSAAPASGGGGDKRTSHRWQSLVPGAIK